MRHVKEEVLMGGEKIISKETGITKSNELSTSKLSTKLSLNQMQLFAYAILSTQRDGLATFNKVDFEKQFNLEKYHTQAIRKDCDKLLDLKVKPYQNEDNWGIKHVFIDMLYKYGTVSFTWHPDMLPHITELKNKYTLLDLSITKNFKSGYSWILYEYLLAKYGYYSIEFTKNELMQLFGVSNKISYINNTSDFKGRVLDVAISEINEFTEYTVKYDELKRGRSINGFKLYFSKSKTLKGATQKQINYIVDLLGKLKEDYIFRIIDIDDAEQATKANSLIMKTLREARGVDFGRLTHDKADELIKHLNSTIKLIETIISDDTENVTNKDKYADFEIPLYDWTSN